MSAHKLIERNVGFCTEIRVKLPLPH